MATGNESGDGGAPRVIDHTFDDETPASFAIINAVCALENVDPVNAPEELGFTLYDHIDPQSLDALIDSGGENGHVRLEFVVGDYHVRVEDTGRLRIRDRD